MKIENKKYYITAFFWIISGYLCWLSSIYTFSYVTSNVLFSVVKFVKSISPSLNYLNTFIIFRLTDYILIFLFAFVMSLISGKKIIWFIGFLIWPIGVGLYYTIHCMRAYMALYPTLPSWVIYWLIESIIVYIIFIPLVGWLGVILGNKLYLKRKNAQQNQYSRSLRSG